MILESKKKKRKVASSITYTTGDIQKNIDHFNKMNGTYDGLPNVELQKAAEEAAEAAGTFASQSPDGASSIELSGDLGGNLSGNCDGCGEGGGEASALAESVATSMPVTILPASDIKSYVSSLPPVDADDKRPPKFFKLGYIKELTSDIAAKYKGGRGSTGMPIIRIFKCIEYSKLYTGFPFIKTNDTKASDKVLGSARHTGEKTGFIYNDSDFTNKIGIYPNGSEALQAYIANDSRQKVRFYISENDSDLIEATRADIATYLTPNAAAKVLAPAARVAAGFDADGNALFDKQVNRFKLSGIYMIGDLGSSLIESLSKPLTEAKRYVRRYYIRPQNIFASNKAEILKALIELDDENCSIYTLNNLEDNNDVTKLTNKDIIYYYDNGILYDKNHVKVMDYDLYIKHEEKRDKIDVDQVSDEKFDAVYDDRMTDRTVVESFNLDFDDINAYGERLVEGKEVDGVCCICGEPIEGYGNNPEPYMSAENGERCCDACNMHFVIPARLDLILQQRNSK